MLLMPRYLVISPVKDEAAYVGRTIASMLGQTCKPVAWIIVDDASRDATPAVLAEQAARQSFIRVVAHAPADRRRRPGAGVIEAFNFGLQQARDLGYDFLVKLDCDLEFPPDYFEGLFRHFAQDPRLGIASGIYQEERRPSRWEPVSMPGYHAAGAAKTLRRECFEQIGGFVPTRGWDTVDEIKAMTRGWTTRHFPELRLRHLKAEGSGAGRWQTSILRGEIYYVTGGGVLFFLLKILRALARRPPLAAGAGMLWGYARARLHHAPLLVSPEEAAYYRSLLNRRLTAPWRRAWAS